MALIMSMLAGGYILLQKSSVQTYIIKKITEQLSLKTGAKISVGKVDFVFFNRLEFNNVLLAGPENDTIFYTSTRFGHLSSTNRVEETRSLQPCKSIQSSIR